MAAFELQDLEVEGPEVVVDGRLSVDLRMCLTRPSNFRRLLIFRHQALSHVAVGA